MRPFDLTSAHGTWQMAAEMHKPDDIPAAVRKLAGQGLKHHDIAAALRIGVTAVEQALRENAAEEAR
jgi:hypothetical protein